MAEIDNDTELMKQFVAGNEEAFVALYQKYRPRIFNFARRLIGNFAQAEEATQDVFIKLYRARKRYEPKSRFSTYLFRIAKNHCINLHALHDNQFVDRGNNLDDQRKATTGNPETAASATQLRLRIAKAIAALPDSQRTAFVLAHFENMRYDEIAEITDISESAVKSLIHRARVQLALVLSPMVSTEEAHGL